jgi:hypothetical protein
MTMAYAAPEIWNEDGPFGKPSHKSDLYAMGVLLFQCLTGFTPFRGNYGALYRAHTEETPDVGLLPTDTPPSLRMLIRRCLEKRQEERPGDAVECLGILKRAQAEQAIARGDATLNEPRKLGPWIKDAPHDLQAWAWRCHHESSGQTATVEVHFADRLDYGAGLRKALAANPKLTPHGAERLIETNRLMLRPNEAWWEPPPGEFQFWVAREDEPIAEATSAGEPELRVAVRALRDLIEAAEAEGLDLDLRGENLALRPDGRIYLRRPGLVKPSENASQAAMAFLRALPLTSDALATVTDAPDVATLAARLTAFDPSATVIMSTSRLAQQAEPALQTQIERPAAVAVPAAPAPATAPQRPPVAVPARASAKGPPVVLLAGGGLAVLAVIVAGVIFMSGGGESEGENQDGDGVALVEKSDYAGTPAASHTLAPNAAANISARPEGREIVESTVLTMNPADWECSDGTTGCRGIYSVGPFRHRGNTLRIEFEVRIVAPPGKGVQWIDDIQADEIRTKNDQEGVQLEGETGSVWHIKAAGGIANENHPSLQQGTYKGYWEFVHEEPPGSTVTFYYPDFDEVITIPLPKR